MCWTVSWKEKCLYPEICIKRYTTARQPPVSLLDVITAILFDSTRVPSCSPCSHYFVFPLLSLSFSLSLFSTSARSRGCVVVVGCQKGHSSEVGWEGDLESPLAIVSLCAGIQQR